MELIDIVSDVREKASSLPCRVNIVFDTLEFFIMVSKDFLVPDEVLKLCGGGVYGGFGFQYS